MNASSAIIGSTQSSSITSTTNELVPLEQTWRKTCTHVIEVVFTFFRNAADTVIGTVIWLYKSVTVFTLDKISSMIVFGKIAFTQRQVERMYHYLPDTLAWYSKTYSHLAFDNRKLSMRDGAIVDGIEISQKAPTDRTIVFLLPNCLLWPNSIDMLSDLATANRANVVCYNWRSTGQGTGPLLTGQELIDDTIEIVESLKKAGKKNIIVHGCSLGGGVAPSVALHFEKKGEPLAGLVSDRSFSSLQKTIRFLFPIGPNWLASFITWAVGWRLNAAEALSQLHCKTLVMFHPHDTMIRSGARLVETAKELKSPSISFMNMENGLHIDSNSDTSELSKTVFSGLQNIIDDEDVHCRNWLPQEKEVYKNFADKAFAGSIIQRVDVRS